MKKAVFTKMVIVFSAVMIAVLMSSGTLLATDYRSLYSYDHTISYCSQTPCDGVADCEEDSYPCGGDYPYKYTDTLQGFRATYDLHDPKIICGQDLSGTGSCAPDEKSLSLTLGTLHQGGLDYISAFPDGFRIFVPPGTVYGYVNIYMPIDGEEGVVVRYQQPPAFQGEYSNVSSWDVPNQVNLNTMKDRDVYLRNWGGLAAAVSPFYLSVPMSAGDSGWLYIRKLPGSSSRIHKISVDFRVNVAGFLSWYDHVIWDSNGDPADIGAGCSADDLDSCDSEERCEGSGFYWYEDAAGGFSCHAEPRCRPDNLGGCENFDECSGIDAYWYDESCNAEPACTQENLSVCENQSECTGSGFYWYLEDGDEVESCHLVPRCRPDNLGGCENFDECSGIDAYWYDNGCNADPACTSEDLGLCDTGDKCEGSGFYWYQDATGALSCHDEPLCRSDNPGGCETSSDCTGVDAYWYDVSCNAEPACTVDNLGSCDTEEKCAGADFYWYNGSCSASPACTPDNLSDCANRVDCQENGGEWHTDGNCVTPSSSSGTGDSGTGSSSSRNSDLDFLSLFFNRPATTSCDQAHQDLCHTQTACEGVGEGYWYDGSCHAMPKQFTVDYVDKIAQAPVRLGGDANDGLLSAGESFALQMDFSDTGEFTRYILIVLPGGDYFFVQNSGDQPFAPLGQVVPYGGASHATLFELQNFCSVLPGYVGEWWVMALRIPAGVNVFTDLDSMATYFADDGQYILDYYTVRLDCSDYVEPFCTVDDLGPCDIREKCQESGFHWYEENGIASCHEQPHCRMDNLEGCESADECEGINAYWYGDSCNVGPACTAGDLGVCDTPEKCEGAGFYWDNGSCTVGTGCSPANPTACTNREDCFDNGGQWYTAGYCK